MVQYVLVGDALRAAVSCASISVNPKSAWNASTGTNSYGCSTGTTSPSSTRRRPPTGRPAASTSWWTGMRP